MDLTIVNSETYYAEQIVDMYKSLIWTDRYNQYGDFELVVPANQENLQIFQNGYYILSDISEHAMIIEDISLTTDVESGVFLIITGRSIESILDRRIIWDQTNISKNTTMINGITKLLSDSIFNPSITERKILNFSSSIVSLSSIVDNLKIDRDMQFTGDNLYETIVKICDMYNIGFKILFYLNPTSNNINFVFNLYSGLDRSYDQNTLPYVEFSPDFDNLINSDYKLVTSRYKNVTLVAGEGEGIDRTRIAINSDAYSGLHRRELYTDARDLSSNIDGGTLTPEEYQNVLINRGLSKLTETGVESIFDAKVDHTQPYIYGQDYNMGDTVQFVNQFGIGYKVRVVESIYSESDNGIEQYPTFEIIEED